MGSATGFLFLLGIAVAGVVLFPLRRWLKRKLDETSAQALGEMSRAFSFLEDDFGMRLTLTRDAGPGTLIEFEDRQFKVTLVDDRGSRYGFIQRLDDPPYRFHFGELEPTLKEEGHDSFSAFAGVVEPVFARLRASACSDMADRLVEARETKAAT